ncbi:MAG: ankyrin repeat domain-containing protein [Candidatus Scalindua sp.]|jgi:ankyrin repeat protein|nr:ankyrin repeat domain-containing protein [Candidatus Scalindua sp.]MBT7211621.1 ankyrin repeat domain-containing protein [Candidatus Scalindua sp.]
MIIMKLHVFLIEQGADVTIKNKKGKTPLHIAVKWNHSNLAELLISHGSNVNEKDIDSWIPLHWAVMESGVEVVKILIDNGTDKNAQIEEDGKMFHKGSTPLDIAVKNKNYEMARFLESHGCRKKEGIHYNTRD